MRLDIDNSAVPRGRPDEQVKHHPVTAGMESLIVPARGLSAEQRESLLRQLQTDTSSMTREQLHSLGGEMTGGRLSVQEVNTVRSNFHRMSNVQAVHLAEALREDYSGSLRGDLQAGVARLRNDLVQRFGDMLGSGVHRVRESATSLLIGLGPDISLSMERLTSSENAEVGGRANYILGQISSAHGSSLFRRYSSGRVDEWLAARSEVLSLEVLSTVSQHARNTLNEFRGCQTTNFLNSLQDGTPEVRAQAIEGLERLQIRPAEQISSMLNRGNRNAGAAIDFIVDRLLHQTVNPGATAESRLQAMTAVLEVSARFPDHLRSGIARFQAAHPNSGINERFVDNIRENLQALELAAFLRNLQNVRP